MLLEVTALEVRLSGLHILRGVDICVNPGELVVVLGANGAGKTTLMRTISGLTHPASGRIVFENREIQSKAPFDIVARGISLVMEGRKLFQDMTVLENLEMGAYLRRRAAASILKSRERVFSLFPVLEKCAGRVAGTLSGGEQQMLTIGRGLMGEPKLLMIDELSLGLAPKVVDSLMKTVTQLNAEGISILLVEQNVRQALKIADRAYILDNGRIVNEGVGSELMSIQDIQSTYMGISTRSHPAS